MTDKILVVEDNLEFQKYAAEFFNQRQIQAVYARDFDEACDALGKLPMGAIIDCLFPKETGSNDITLGLDAVAGMESVCPDRRTDNPASRALSQVEELLGTDFAKLAAKNAGVDYRNFVNKYDALRKAMMKSEANQPLGIMVGAIAKLRGVPFVLATSTYHHDLLTQPITDYAGRRGWTLLDCYPEDKAGKASVVFWERAYVALEREMGERK